MQRNVFAQGKLSACSHPATVNSTGRPVPLVATTFTVRIVGGLAVVTTERTFRNVEEQSIEATMSFGRANEGSYNPGRRNWRQRDLGSGGVARQARRSFGQDGRSGSPRRVCVEGERSDRRRRACAGTLSRVEDY